MAQKQYSVGTKLTTPFGTTITVSDPNQFFSEQYVPVSVPAPVSTPAPKPVSAPVSSPTKTAPPSQQGTVTIYDSKGNANTVPSIDLSYWQSQGWSTSKPSASSTPTSATVNPQGMTVQQMVAAGNGQAPIPPVQAPINDSRSIDTNSQVAPPVDQTGASQTPSVNMDGWSEAQKASFSALQGYITELQNQGKTVNPSIEITPEMTAKFLEQAKTESAPYYSQLISQAQQDLTKGFGNIAQDYQANVRDIGQAYGQNLENTQESFARRGLEFSSDRTRAEQQLAESATKSIESAKQAAQRSASTLGTSGERQLGSSFFQTPSALETGYKPITGQAGQYGITSGGGRETLFNPTGGTTGTLEQQRLADEEKRKLELINNERALRGQYTA